MDYWILKIDDKPQGDKNPNFQSWKQKYIGIHVNKNDIYYFSILNSHGNLPENFHTIATLFGRHFVCVSLFSLSLFFFLTP